MPNLHLASAPELVTVELTCKQRWQLDGYLAVLASGDTEIAELASRCRQALNVRAVTLGRAKDPEAIDFMPDERTFLLGQLVATRDGMDELVGALT